MRSDPTDIPDIVAHRGLHTDWPENSLGAMKAAWNAGFEWCECDIHLAADGQPVVIHDETLDRTTTGRGAVSKYFGDELRQLHLWDRSRKPTGEKLATLVQLLDAMPADAGLLIEIKPSLQFHELQSILRLINGRRCILQSFNRPNVEKVSQCDIRTPTAWLVDDADSLISDGHVVPSPFTSINADYRTLNGPAVRLLHEAGKRVGAWTVNKELDIRSMLAMGIDTIISDQPAAVARLMYGTG
ncbi:MAG: glycerophosphodiester phosphodiesterase family protein [Planctomycetota bacterium]|nr:glycerophosphodiester phosphodiesterase family protein [Planctomycetota bacterium]